MMGKRLSNTYRYTAANGGRRGRAGNNKTFAWILSAWIDGRFVEQENSPCDENVFPLAGGSYSEGGDGRPRTAINK